MTVIGKDRYSENMLQNRRYKASKCPQCKAKTHEEAEKLCSATQDITGEYSCAGDECSLNPFGIHWDTTGRACELVAADARAEAKALDDWCKSEMDKMEGEDESRAGLEPATSRSLIERANQTALPTDAASLPRADNTAKVAVGNIPSPQTRELGDG